MEEFDFDELLEEWLKMNPEVKEILEEWLKMNLEIPELCEEIGLEELFEPSFIEKNIRYLQQLISML